MDANRLSWSVSAFDLVVLCRSTIVLMQYFVCVIANVHRDIPLLCSVGLFQLIE